MLIAITVVQLLAALVLILIVLFQSGKSQGPVRRHRRHCGFLYV